MGQRADERPPAYDQVMSVMEHLQIQLGVACCLRWLLMAVLAAALVWSYPEHSVSMLQRLWMFAAFLLYLWLLGALLAALLGVPMARLRCPRCTGKFALKQGATSCPKCNVSFDARVQRDWPWASATRSPWLTGARALRMGRNACTAVIAACANSPPVDSRPAPGAAQAAVDERREDRGLEQGAADRASKGRRAVVKRVGGQTVYDCIER